MLTGTEAVQLVEELGYRLVSLGFDSHQEQTVSSEVPKPAVRTA